LGMFLLQFPEPLMLPFEAGPESRLETNLAAGFSSAVSF